MIPLYPRKNQSDCQMALGPNSSHSLPCPLPAARQALAPLTAPAEASSDSPASLSCCLLNPWDWDHTEGNSKAKCELLQELLGWDPGTWVLSLEATRDLLCCVT